jgi:cytoskeletal protein CcmA (bactofilin family)
VTITLSSAGSSGSPNTIAITNGASSTGRNKYIEFADGGDLSAAAYVQLTPNDAEKICFIRNSLTASRSIFLFQGTYSTSNDIEIIAGTDVLVKFNGGGTGATVVNVYANLAVNGLDVAGLVEFNSLSGTGSVAITDILDQDNMSGNSATALATQQSIKAYVDAQVDTADTLAEILAIGNTSGGTGLTMSSGDDLNLTGANYNALWDSSDSIFYFTDNAKATFGTGADLLIYHDGSNSYVNENGTGKLILATNGAQIDITGSSETMATFVDDGAVSLYYDNAVKIATTSGGVDVTGLVEFDSLSGTGSVAITDILDQDNMSSNSATALATQQSIKAYVDAQVGTADTLSEILAIGNTTGGTDVAVSTDDKVQFRDAAIYINSSTDGQLDIVADTEIQIAATTIDINGAINASGEIIAASLDISGDVDIDGTTNLDVVDIDGAVNIAAATTIDGANKVQFRDTGIYLNSSTDGQLDIVADTEIQIAATTIDINGAINASGEIIAASLDISGDVDIDGTTNLDIVDIDGAVNIAAATTMLGTLTVGVNDTGHDVKVFGATSGKYVEWDESVDRLTVSGNAVGLIVGLSDAASISTNLTLSNNFSVTLAGNRTLANPTNIAAGQSGSIFITQDGTGSRTLAYGSYFKFVGGTAPTLSTAAAAVDRIDYVVATTTKIHAVVSLDVK